MKTKVTPELIAELAADGLHIVDIDGENWVVNTEDGMPIDKLDDLEMAPAPVGVVASALRDRIDNIIFICKLDGEDTRIEYWLDEHSYMFVNEMVGMQELSSFDEAERLITDMIADEVEQTKAFVKLHDVEETINQPWLKAHEDDE